MKRTAAVCAATAALFGAGFALALSALQLTPLVIISGSMEPEFPVGTIVYSETVAVEEVDIGDVVTTDRFNGPGTVTHRVVHIDFSSQIADGTAVLTLKGDANSGIDREGYTVTEVGVTRFAVPYIGLPQLWVQDLLGIDPLLHGSLEVPRAMPDSDAEVFDTVGDNIDDALG
ncbi:signal peptidase I [Microbacterium amylolyticum]|uniref:Signal peptidase I n=1 Tax=Microbacterium amylolyticum TaxID=936337 RepID=A0ABS4ZF92_9MICO|nr:signal peptidase I [Microbacterium amylolyticum]MBP2435668.1 signal peptidase [Microbacterium amylolyticum]